MSQRFHIRYRCTDRPNHTALIVEDERGTAYLFSGGALQSRTSGTHATEAAAASIGCTRVLAAGPGGAPFDLDGLRRLTRPMPGHATDEPR